MVEDYPKEYLLKQCSEELSVLLIDKLGIEKKKPIDYFLELYQNTEDIWPGFADECTTEAMKIAARENKFMFIQSLIFKVDTVCAKLGLGENRI